MSWARGWRRCRCRPARRKKTPQRCSWRSYIGRKSCIPDGTFKLTSVTNLWKESVTLTWNFNDMFHYLFKVEFVTLVSLKVPSGFWVKWYCVATPTIWHTFPRKKWAIKDVLKTCTYRVFFQACAFFAHFFAEESAHINCEGSGDAAVRTLPGVGLRGVAQVEVEGLLPPVDLAQNVREGVVVSPPT